MALVCTDVASRGLDTLQVQNRDIKKQKGKRNKIQKAKHKKKICIRKQIKVNIKVKSNKIS